MNRLIVGLIAPLLLSALSGAPGQDRETIAKADFSAKELGKEWAAPASWALEEGELRGKGTGSFTYVPGVTGDFSLTFDAWIEEKANIEVALVDAKTNQVIYTCAFIGKYHSVLDGVKSAILKDDGFVSICPKMWIYPGRMFTFEVRHEKNELQMFLNHELGPFFVDPQPPDPGTPFKFSIIFAPEGARDKVRMDNVAVTVPKKKK